MKLKTAQDLTRFLKLLSQESVKLALEGRTSPEEEQVNQKKMASKFKKLDEEDEEKDPLFPDEEEPKEKGDELDLDKAEPKDDLEEPEEDLEAEPKAEEKPQKQYKPVSLDLKLGEITVDGIGSVLNLMRGGRSFKDPNVAKELRKYFESLTEAEKLAMATFLSALKDIGVGETADKAPEPSNPELNLSISSRDANKNTQQQSQQQPQQAQTTPQTQSQQQAPMPQTIPQQPNEELEDTTAPIVVGRRNEGTEKEFREKIRELIKRGQSL